MRAAPVPRSRGGSGNSNAANGTWLEAEEFAYPRGGMTRRCYAVCSDGRKRVVRCGIPDTYFSIPAYATISGKRVKGYVCSDEEGFHFKQYVAQAEHQAVPVANHSRMP